MVERAVELVGLYDYVRARRVEQIVRPVVFRDAAQEGVAAYVAFVEQVGQHGRRRGLAVRARHAEAAHVARQQAQYLGALVYLESGRTEIVQLAVVRRDGRRIYNQRVPHVAARSGMLSGLSS